MYKKIFTIIIISLFLLVLTACAEKEDNTIYESAEVAEEKLVDYKISKIVLSRAFQITDANVNIIEKGANLKLLVNAGLVESSGINIDRITMTGNALNIYLARKIEENKIQLAVPQITLEIDEEIKVDPNNTKFNIIPLNYEPISIKFNKNQILDKICNELKIEPTTLPEVELCKEDDNILWNVHFPFMLDKENSKSSLFNLFVKADATTGKILETEKQNVSTYLDHGHLLDYKPNELLLYKQEHTEKGTTYESLWSYDINSGSKKKLYTTTSKINTALISPNGRYISLIEKGKSKNDIFLIDRIKNIAFKITPINYLHPTLMKWKDKDNLYFTNIDGNNTTLLLYNINKNSSSKVLNLDKIIESFDVYDDKIIFAEYDQYSINKNLYLIENKDEMKLIGTGFKPMLFNNKYIIYLENIENKNKNNLKIYSTEEKSVVDTLDYNILNYYKLDNNNLLFVENLNLNNQFNFGKYNVNDNISNIISQINSDKLFYNPEKKIAYISLTIPTKEKNVYNIYSIDLTKMNSNKTN
jgi:DNA-binding Xre family transcriptional regulator